MLQKLIWQRVSFVFAILSSVTSFFSGSIVARRRLSQMAFTMSSLQSNGTKEADDKHQVLNGEPSLSSSSSSPYWDGNHQKVNGGSHNSNVLRFTSPLLDEEHEHKTALIVLNSPLSTPPSPLFQRLWNIASGRICADGGANRLYQSTKDLTDTHQQNLYIPNIIRGELDSLKPHVRDYYHSRGVLIEGDPCQDTNDLDKALQVCQSKFGRILVFGAFGGRFDQEMASLQALYKWGPTFGYEIFLYTDETCAFLIPAQEPCEIRLPFYDTFTPDSEKCSLKLGEGPTCGLIPIGCKVDSITTTGLKWNLAQNALEFGGLVSSSNRIMEPVVTVKSSHPVVFTAEVQL